MPIPTHAVCSCTYRSEVYYHVSGNIYKWQQAHSRMSTFEKQVLTRKVWISLILT